MKESYDAYRRELWRDKAAAYQRSLAGLCAHPVSMLLDAVGVTAATSVLDVGCGSGSLTEAAVARGAVVTSVDAEASMVEATAARVPTSATAIAALPFQPFPDGRFDAVAGNFVVNHVARPAAAVTELRRVTRGGGRVGVTVWPHPVPPLQRLWDEVIEAAEVIRPPMPVTTTHDDFPRTREGLGQLLARAGLDDVESAVVRWNHRVHPEQWWAGAAEGLASVGYVVSRQNEATVARMKREYDRLAAAHLDEQGMLCLPTAALLASGTARRRGPAGQAAR
jgi:SAM-dependent methyltransferase